LNTGAWFPGIHQKERKATTGFLASYAKEHRGARLIKYALPNTSMSCTGESSLKCVCIFHLFSLWKRPALPELSKEPLLEWCGKTNLHLQEIQLGLPHGKREFYH
jgi:hypothetical protein